MLLYVLDRKPIFQTGHWSAAPRKPRQQTARHISGTGGCGSSAAPACRMFLLEAVPRDRSFDHLVGERHQIVGEFDPERLRRLEIDHELKLGRLQDRQVRWLGTFEDADDIDADLAI